MAVLADVDRVHESEVTLLRDRYLSQGRPVVVTGARFWTHDRPLTPELLRELYGERALAELVSPTAFTGISSSHVEAMPTLARFIERLRAEDDRSRDEFSLETPSGVPYITNLGLPNNFPELMRWFAPPAWLGRNLLLHVPARREAAQGELFIGPRNTMYRSLHWDTESMTVATYQFFGRKRWVLFAPTESEKLYPIAKHGRWFAHHSPIDVDAPDLDQYPRYAEATGYTATLEAGEFLVCPPRWWHDARNVTAQISIAVRMVTTSSALKHVLDVAATRFINAQVDAYRRWLLRRRT